MTTLQFSRPNGAQWRHVLGAVTTEYAERSRADALAGLARHGYTDVTAEIRHAGQQPALPGMEERYD